jgi:hypothetical protein
LEKFSATLDNDRFIRQLGWDPSYHQAIHLPEHILSGYGTSIVPPDYKLDSNYVYVVMDGEINPLLFQLLQLIYKGKINLHPLSYTPENWQPDGGLLIIPDYQNKLQLLTPGDNIFLLNSRDQYDARQPQLYFSADSLHHADGLGIFLGVICRFLDNLCKCDNSNLISILVAFLMKKAGAIAIAMPIKYNFAKQLAIILLKSHNWQIKALSPEFEVIGQYWRDILSQTADIYFGKGNVVCLTKIWSQHNETKCAQKIFADGVDTISQISSFYYLVNITAVYLAILKKTIYPKE